MGRSGANCAVGDPLIGYTAIMSDPIKTISDVQERLDGVRTAMVTSLDERGTLSSRPVTLQEIDVNGDVWFLVDAKASWVGPIDAAPVNASVSDSDVWVSLAGRASVIREETRIQQLTNRVTEAFFAKDADPVALCVVTDRIEWWTSDGAVSTALKVAKAAVTGGAANAGQSGSIEA